MRKYRLIFVAILTFIFISVSEVLADNIDSFINEITSKDLVFAEFDGIVMQNNPQEKSIVVLEKTVQLVDENIDDYQLRTIVKNQYGTAIQPELLQQGTRVFIRGIGNRDGSVLAREIYEIGHDMQIDRLKRNIPDWKPVKGKQETARQDD